MAKTNSAKLRVMAQTAILAAVILIMAFTPLGYLKIGVLSITFITIPVALGAIVISPSVGAILGAVFGATSFIQCFGLDVTGTMLLSINPFFTFIMCMLPRVALGWLCGLIFRALKKIDRTKIVSYVVASLSAALLNTIFFIGLLVLFFGSNAQVQETYSVGSMGALAMFFISVIGIQALVEAGACAVLGGAVSKALDTVINRKKKPDAVSEQK